MKYDAYLFDMDGTLVDTPPLWDRACRLAIAHHQIPFTEEEFANLAAITLKESLHMRGILPEDNARIRATRDTAVLEVMRNETRWHTGAQTMLSTLEKCPKAIVTSADHVLADAIHTAIGIRSHFDAVIAGDDVRPDYKPHPKGVLLACERLGVSPQKCLFIGDQACDMEAAMAAGMDAILFRTKHTPASVIHPREVSSLEDIIPHL